MTSAPSPQAYTGLKSPGFLIGLMLKKTRLKENLATTAALNAKTNEVKDKILNITNLITTNWLWYWTQFAFRVFIT